MSREERLRKVLHDNKDHFDIDEDGRLIPKPPEPPKSGMEYNPEPPALNIVIGLLVLLWIIYVFT
jgi:hypothetical protein|nr:MAG TPA: hypothetical protein [Caudoviricetes sp.]